MSLPKSRESFLAKWSVHLTLFFFMLGMMLQQFVAQNMVLHKLCMRDHDEGVCRDLSAHQAVQDEVQGESSSYLNLQMICLGLPSAFSTLILGAASDRYGRRKIMILTSFGVTLFTVSVFYQSIIVGLSTPVLVLGSLATGVTGGIMSFIGTMTNYITDVTPEKERTATLSKVFSFMGLGAMSGTLSAGTLESLFGFQVVLALSSMFELLALLLLIFFLKDVIPPHHKNAESRSIWGEMVAGAKCLFQDSPDGHRTRKMVLLFNGIVAMAYAMCESGITMLYTKRPPFNWTSSYYGFYAASKQISSVLGQVFGTSMIIKAVGSSGSIRTDFTILQIGTVMIIAGNLIAAYSTSGLVLLLGIPLCVLVGPAQATGGSITSKLVDADKKGSYTAFTSFLCTFMAPLLSAGFNHLYSSSVKDGAPNLVFFAFASFQLMTLFALSFAKRGLAADANISDHDKSS